MAGYGLSGTRPTRCIEHKLAAFVHLGREQCQHKSCETIPSFGPIGAKKALACKKHSQKDWIHLKKSYCHEKGCKTVASFGVAVGDPLSCTKHRLPNYKNVVSPTCFFEGCMKVPNFGPDKKAVACKSHSQLGWKDVGAKMCQHPGCESRSWYGLLKGKPVYCRKHRSSNMYVVTRQPCRHEGCLITPTFGIEAYKPLVCSLHNTEGWGCVMSRTCFETGCDVQVGMDFIYCANHDTTQKRNTRVRENQIANLLRESASIPWSSWNREIQNGRACDGIYRPDFFYDLDTHILVVEVDEMQHSSYDCDRSRMVDIHNACGGAPVTFVRYNPDGFKLAGKKLSADTATRHELLLREVEKGLAGKVEHHLTVVKLFFDNDQDDFVQRSWIDVNDHRFTETSIANST